MWRLRRLIKRLEELEAQYGDMPVRVRIGAPQDAAPVCWPITGDVAHVLIGGEGGADTGLYLIAPEPRPARQPAPSSSLPAPAPPPPKEGPMKHHADPGKVFTLCGKALVAIRSGRFEGHHYTTDPDEPIDCPACLNALRGGEPTPDRHLEDAPQHVFSVTHLMAVPSRREVMSCMMEEKEGRLFFHADCADDVQDGDEPGPCETCPIRALAETVAGWLPEARNSHE